MAETRKLVDYTNSLLRIDRFSDYCPNGLQVQGKPELQKLVSGVSASQALIDAAIDVQADAILVHHGYFWKGEQPSIVGLKKNRIRALLLHDINLLAYHLPLDAHELYGNNVQLAARLDITVDRQPEEQSSSLVRTGTLQAPISAQAFAARISERIGRVPLWIGEGETSMLAKVAWCTGAAQGYIEQAVALGVDAYITGEVSEQTVHVARECGIHFFAAGHHATERYGVQALGSHLADQFQIDHQFIEIDNPV